MSTKFLNSREVDRLFRAWGFVPVKTRGRHAGGHKFYAWQVESGSRVAITAPGRAKSTPPMALKKAAEIAGVSVQEFLGGPVKEKVMSEMSEMTEVKEMEIVEEGIVGEPMVVQEVDPVVVQEVEGTKSPTLERQMLTVAEYIERANRPLTTREVAKAFGLNLTTIRVALNEAVRHGLLFTRYATTAECRGRGAGGRRPLLFSHLNPVPRRRAKIEAEIQERVQAVEAVVEAAVEAVQAPVAVQSAVTFTLLKTKADGTLVLLDGDGNLYRAQMVEV